MMGEAASTVGRTQDRSRILVLGASGMLGNAVLRYFAQRPDYSVFGSVRSARAAQLFAPEVRDRIVFGGDVQDFDGLAGIFAKIRPDIVVNCVGIVKQLAEADDPLVAIPINAVLPHRLARLSAIAGARLIHLSTDCVFSGRKGAYVESDFADCYDLYGRSKLLGEVDDENSLTLRTSIIGHELGGSANGLLNWFLAQNGQVDGYRRAIFSGLPTVEIARVIDERILPNPSLRGVYHLSADPIAKYDLLEIFAQVYARQIAIRPSDAVAIDRSLDSSRFRTATGYAPPSWLQLVQEMRRFG